MKQVMVMRHGHAEWGGGANTGAGGDHARHLSDKGREDAKALGQYMAGEGLAPGLIYCSSAQRTRETLDFILPALEQKRGHEPRVLTEKGLYNADERALLSFTVAALPDAGSLLLLAHNPGVHGFAMGLLSEVADGVETYALSEGYPPGTLCVFSFDVDSWALVAPHTGLLTHCHTPG